MTRCVPIYCIKKYDAKQCSYYAQMQTALVHVCSVIHLIEVASHPLLSGSVWNLAHKHFNQQAGTCFVPFSIIPCVLDVCGTRHKMWVPRRKSNWQFFRKLFDCFWEFIQANSWNNLTVFENLSKQIHNPPPLCGPY